MDNRLTSSHGFNRGRMSEIEREVLQIEKSLWLLYHMHLRIVFYILRKSDAAEEWNKKIEKILLKSLQFEKQCGIMSIGHNSVMTVKCPSQL